MLVLVMGMGRSGTSLLMQTLQAAGFDSGTDLIPADEHNPKGYIESMSIMSFNVSLLNAASGNPEDQFPLPDEDAIERLVGTPIPVQFPQHDYAVKDPRFTLTFPIWYPYLKQFDLRVVLARRNTESIAESVLRASGVPLARIRYLTEEYIKRGKKYIERYNLRSTTIWYEDWFKDPEKNLRLLEGLLDRPLNINIREIADAKLVRCPGDIKTVDQKSIQPGEKFVPLREFVTDNQKENLYRLRRQHPKLSEQLESYLKEQSIEIRKSDLSTYHCRRLTPDGQPQKEWFVKELTEHTGRPCSEYREYSPEQQWLIITKTSGVCPACLIEKSLTPFRPVTIIEPDPAVFLSYLSIRSFVPLFNLPQVKWFVGQDAFQRFQESLDSELEPYFVSAGSARAVVGDRDCDEDFTKLREELNALGRKVSSKFKEIGMAGAAFRNKFLQENGGPVQRILTVRPGYAFPSSVASGVAAALRQQGMEVFEGCVAYSFTENPLVEPSRIPDVLRILLQVYRLKPDCIVSINNAAEFFTRPIANVPFPTIVWYWENTAFPKTYQHREHDYLLTCSHEIADDLKAHGGHYLGELPVAGAPLVCSRRDEFTCDIGFVGSTNDTAALRANMPQALLEAADSIIEAKLKDVRVPLEAPKHALLSNAAELIRVLKPSVKLRGLSDERLFVLFMEMEWNQRRQVDILSCLDDFDLKIYGSPDWRVVLQNTPVASAYQGKTLKDEEYQDLCHSASIMLNIHPPYLHDAPLLPETFVPMCDGFLLTDVGVHAGERLKEFFDPEREIALFRGPEDVAEKVEYYLSRPEERQTISAAAKDRILRDHSFEHRTQRILEILQSIRPQSSMSDST